MIFTDRQHQCRLLRGILECQRRVGVHQCFHGIERSAADCCPQRRLSNRIQRIGIGASFDQEPNHLRIAIGRCNGERRHAKAVGKFRICSCSKQQFCRLDIVDKHHPVEGRCPVIAKRIYSTGIDPRL